MEKTKKELTKEKIQQAAYKCVARFGFEKTTLEDIAKEVGLNKASLYYYYKNKEEIFLDVTTTETAQFVEKLKMTTLEQVGIEKQVFHYLYERSVYYLHLIEGIHISEETLRQVEPLFNDLIKDIEAQEVAFLKNIIDTGINEKKLQNIDSQRFAYNVLTLSVGIKDKARNTFQDIPAVSNEIKHNLFFMLDLLFRGVKL
jgi:TetR/AcrR family transcriptional regulator, biofilm operon repressor